jgi:esterase/lipase
MNMALMGFGRICTPRAWLSTWSGLSSNADLMQTLPEIEQPTLVVNAGRDREIYPESDAKPIFAAVGASDRTFHSFPDARHYFEPEFGAQDAPDVEALMDLVLNWIQERFA